MAHFEIPQGLWKIPSGDHWWIPRGWSPHLLSPSAAHHMAVCQNLVPLVNIKIAGKWMFNPLKMVFIGIDPYQQHQFLPIKVAITRLAPQRPQRHMPKAPSSPGEMHRPLWWAEPWPLRQKGRGRETTQPAGNRWCLGTWTMGQRWRNPSAV